MVCRQLQQLLSWWSRECWNEHRLHSCPNQNQRGLELSQWPAMAQDRPSVNGSSWGRIQTSPSHKISVSVLNEQSGHHLLWRPQHLIFRPRRMLHFTQLCGLMSHDPGKGFTRVHKTDSEVRVCEQCLQSKPMGMGTEWRPSADMHAAVLQVVMRTQSYGRAWRTE